MLEITQQTCQDNDNENEFIVKVVQNRTIHYTTTKHITTNNMERKA